MKFRRYVIYTILFIFIVLLFIWVPRTAPEKAGLSRFRPVTISYAYCSTNEEVEDIINEMVDKFNKTVGKDVGIIVETKNYRSIEYFTSLVNDVIVGGVSSTRISDINTVTYETAYLAKTMNKIASMDDYLSEDILYEYVNGYLERGRYTSDSQRAVFPTFNDTKVIYVNDVLWQQFKDANPIYDDSVFETWEDIIEVSMRYYDWTDSLTPHIDGDGKAFIAFDSIADYIFTSSNQLMSSIIQPGHKEVRINLDRRGLNKLWEHIYKGFIYGGISLHRAADNSDLMANGEVVSYVSSTKNVNDFPLAFIFQNKVNETRLKAFSFPTFRHQRKVSPIDGEGVIVMKSDKKKEYACFFFLDWLVTQKEYISICYNEMLIPVKEESIKSEYAASLIEEGLNSKEFKKRYKAIVYETAGRQILEGEAYSPVAFYKSKDFIEDVVDSFYDNVYAGITEVDRLIEKGYDRRTSVEIASDEDLFEQWYKSITNIAEKY